MQHHLGVWCLKNLLYCLLGNPKHMVLLVVSANARHLFEIADVASPSGLLSIYPQLTEINGTSVEVRHVCNH